MIRHFRLMYPDLQDGIDATADHKKDLLVINFPGNPRAFSLSYARRMIAVPYDIPEPKEGWKRVFTETEKGKLRPIAETLAMLDGNAFFSIEVGEDREWYESYLPEAHALYERNGGDNGWAGESSIGRPYKASEKKLTVADAATSDLEGARVQSQKRGTLGKILEVTFDDSYGKPGFCDPKDHVYVKILWDHGGTSEQKQSDLDRVDFLGKSD